MCFSPVSRPWRLPPLSWRRRVVVSVPSFRDPKRPRGGDFFGWVKIWGFFWGGRKKNRWETQNAQLYTEYICIYIYMYIFVFTEVFFCSVLEFWWFLVLDLDGCKIGVLSTHEGSWRLAWNVFLPLRHNAQKAWTVTGAATNSLVACFTTELHGDCIRSIGRTPIKTNFQPRSLALQVIFFFLLWLCQLVVVVVGPECPIPGLGEVKAFARDVERATQQLKELWQEVQIFKDSMGIPICWAKIPLLLKYSKIWSKRVTRHLQWPNSIGWSSRNEHPTPSTTLQTQFRTQSREWPQPKQTPPLLPD